jgi:hypothetical protein
MFNNREKVSQLANFGLRQIRGFHKKIQTKTKKKIDFEKVKRFGNAKKAPGQNSACTEGRPTAHFPLPPEPLPVPSLSQSPTPWPRMSSLPRDRDEHDEPLVFLCGSLFDSVQSFCPSPMQSRPYKPLCPHSFSLPKTLTKSPLGCPSLERRAATSAKEHRRISRQTELSVPDQITLSVVRTSASN